MDFFHGKFIKSWGEFVKIQELAVVIISVIFLQKQQFRLKNKKIKISRYSAQLQSFAKD